jgi:predicted signal transduction protein with EAL and GGDEF domain
LSGTALLASRPSTARLTNWLTVRCGAEGALLTHGLGLPVIAEGVEDAATLLVLATNGCDAVQGHFMGQRAVVAVGQRVASASER